MENPSLRSEPRHQPASVIPRPHDASILDWLEGTGRLLARDSQERDFLEQEEEISELMAGDDSDYDDIDDDDDLLELED